MWRAGFFFHEMAFGLLSVFIPIYVIVTLGGTLLEVGIMTAVALFLTIPASFFWGYACDKTRRYKRFILLSFLSMAIPRRGPAIVRTRGHHMESTRR